MSNDQTNPVNQESEADLLAQPLRMVAPKPTRHLRVPQVRVELRALVEPRWQKRAACAAADPEAWFPTEWSAPVEEVTRLCAACPVNRSCLAVAVLWNEDGIWAGTNPDQRGHAYRLLRLGVSAADVLELLLSPPPVGSDVREAA